MARPISVETRCGAVRHLSSVLGVPCTYLDRRRAVTSQVLKLLRCEPKKPAGVVVYVSADNAGSINVRLCRYLQSRSISKKPESSVCAESRRNIAGKVKCGRERDLRPESCTGKNWDMQASRNKRRKQEIQQVQFERLAHTDALGHFSASSTSTRLLNPAPRFAADRFPGRHTTGS